MMNVGGSPARVSARAAAAYGDTPSTPGVWPSSADQPKWLLADVQIY